MNMVGTVARALVSRKWWWVTLVVIALMILLARLGTWQLDRLAQRRAANAQLAAALESTPIELNGEIDSFAAQLPEDASADLANRNVVMTGQYDFENQRILKLQSWNGRAGVHLITPFVLDGTGEAILVNRGWVPDAAHQAGQRYDEATGLQTVEGYIALTETIARRTADAIVPVSPGLELFRVDIDLLEPELPYDLLPFYVKLISEDRAPDQLPVPVPREVDLSEGPHLDYALQWFVFSLGLGIGYIVYVTRWLKMQGAEAQPAMTGD